jgi:hypothetical protein
MLDEIIPGELYLREDGAVLQAHLDGGESLNCISFMDVGRGQSDGRYRWMKSGVRPAECPGSWDKNPIAGTVPNNDVRKEKGMLTGFAFIECVSKPKYQPTQLELFDV